jgi:hypothetical protein
LFTSSHETELFAKSHRLNVRDAISHRTRLEGVCADIAAVIKDARDLRREVGG